MDLKIPQIKIDLHDDVSEDGNKDELPRPRGRALSTPDVISFAMDLRQDKRNKMPKAMSFDEGFISRESKENSSDQIMKREVLERVERPSRKETKIPKSQNSEGTSEDKILPKRQSLPTLPASGKRVNGVDALVSPLMLRKFNMPKGISTNGIPQRGAKNLIESRYIKRGPKSPRLPRIKSVWTSFDGSSENINDLTSPFPNQYSPSLTRRDKLGVYSVRQQEKDEEVFNAIKRPRSNSLNFLDNNEQEIVDTYHKPSEHWRLAKNHLTTGNMKLPNVVELYQNRANTKKTTGSRTISNHLEHESIRGKTSRSKSKTKDLFAHNKDGSEETQPNQIIALERRLEAIEIKHGIMHQNLEQNQK